MNHKYAPTDEQKLTHECNDREKERKNKAKKERERDDVITFEKKHNTPN